LRVVDKKRLAVLAHNTFITRKPCHLEGNRDRDAYSINSVILKKDVI
jgi:hypothetical protein